MEHNKNIEFKDHTNRSYLAQKKLVKILVRFTATHSFAHPFPSVFLSSFFSEPYIISWALNGGSAIVNPIYKGGRSANKFRKLQIRKWSKALIQICT